MEETRQEFPLPQDGQPQDGQPQSPYFAIRQAAHSGQMRGMRDGFDAGYRTGRQAALDAAQAEADKLRATRAEEAAELEARQQAAIERMREALPGEAVALTRQVLRAALGKDDAAFLALFGQAAAHVRAAGHAVLRASRHDCGIAVRHMDALKRAIDGLEELELRPADGVEDGACILETAAGSVDVGVHTQLAKALQIAGLDDEGSGGDGHAACAGH